MILNSARNTRLILNYYLQPITHTHCHDKYSKHLFNKMQPSITAFFKTKPPPSKKNEEEEAPQNDENKSEDKSDNEPQVVSVSKTTRQLAKKEADKAFMDWDDGSDDDEPQVVRNSKTTPTKSNETSKKRALDSDEDSDEGPIMAPRNNKRRALSSTESSPVKTNNSQPGEKVETDVEEIKSSGDEGLKVTPTKPKPSLQQQAALQSPLFNVELLVKKKISTGASALHPNIGVTWFKALQGEFDKPYFKKLSSFIQEERQKKTVFPPPEQVYTWTHYHAIKDTRVVILGQDPYHGPNQAHGLSFSVQKGISIPKSLVNIYKELQNDVPNFKHPGHGNLIGWSKQGVLLLNACLTVNKGEPNSHAGKGWETFTDAVISWISKNATHNVVFILWGKYAQKKSNLIAKRHKTLISAHPSPFSVDGFFGCKHFSQTNAYLKSQKLTEIDWAAL